MTKRELIAYELGLSAQKVGKLYPVLLDKDGNVIDGQHRLEADATWPKIQLDHIVSVKERLLAWLVSNVCRRILPASEKRDMLDSLARIYAKEGMKPGKIADQIAKETGMSYRWVMRYLSDEMKARPGLGGPKPCANEESDRSIDRSDK